MTKKRSSLKLSPIFCPKSGEDQKKKNFTQGPELFRAPESRPPVAPGTMYPLNLPLVGPVYKKLTFGGEDANPRWKTFNSQWGNAGASPAGGQCPPDFRFCPPRFISCPPRYFWGRKKLLFLAGKNV